MKATLVRLMTISTLAVADFPEASSAADVTGTWNISASTTDPCNSGQMTLEQTGNTFTGVVSLSSPGFPPCYEGVEGRILSGSVSGLDVSFTVSLPIWVSTSGDFTVTGALTSDEMTMLLSAEPFFSGTWSATRVLPCGEGVSQAPEGCTPPAVAFVRALALDPNTPRTLYAGTGRYFGQGGAIGGVLKSTDGGSTWSASGRGLSLLSPVIALAIDPTTPGTLYAGTREDNAGKTGGVYKSTDGGSTWKAVNAGLPPTDLSVVVLVIDPTTPSTLYAGTYSYGVYKSTDGGSSWRPASLGSEVSVVALAIDPTTPSTLYAGGYFDGVSKSTDGASSWRPTSGFGSFPVGALAIDPTTPSTLYAGADFLGVLKTTDGGGTWSGGDYGQFMESRFSALAIDPTNPRTLYAAGDGMYRSTDGGSSLLPFNTSLPRSYVSALAIDPTTRPSTLYVGTDDGVFSIQPGAGCIGDCGRDGTVTIDELVTGIRIALNTLPLSQCPSFDAGDDDDVTVDDLIAAVSSALNGCPIEGME